jgi:S1-C subfamily serine protease
MRLAPWFIATVAFAVLISPASFVRATGADDEAKGKTEDKKGEKKDTEVKGKIPDSIKKQIQDNKVSYGVVLIEVQAGGPAVNGHEKAKGEGDTVMLEEGDIITHVDGKEIKTAADFHKAMSSNDEKKLTVIDQNTGKTAPNPFYFKPKDGKLGIVFEMIAPQVG